MCAASSAIYLRSDVWSQATTLKNYAQARLFTLASERPIHLAALRLMLGDRNSDLMQRRAMLTQHNVVPLDYLGRWDMRLATN
jgi:hypothetical protein